MTKETLDELRKIGWQPVTEGQPLPDWVTNVVLCNSAECYKREAKTRIQTEVFRRPPQGWSPVIGWELWFPLP